MENIKTSFIEDSNKIKWEAFVTLNCECNPILCSDPEKHYRRFMTAICKSEGKQIAAMGILVYHDNKHMHLLLAGRNRFGKNLLSMDTKECEKLWKGNCKIELIYDQQNLLGYLRDLNMYDRKYTVLIPYNTKLLKKLKVENIKPQKSSFPYPI